MEIFGFGLGVQSPESDAKVLGGKGAGLVWMDQLGVRVPPGFVIPTSACAIFRKNPDQAMLEVKEGIASWLDRLKMKFGYMPLLSVRSGAPVSMPGMMDTILNVGLDSETVGDWVTHLGAACVADCRRRLISMYGSVVDGLDKKMFEGLDAPQSLIQYQAALGKKFPDFQGQLLGSIAAVFRSWDNERAKTYRKMNGIAEDMGTAVVVQAMVFGNLNDDSCTGVLFTRNPDTGEDTVTGEFLPRAQGEDVVAGEVTPLNLEAMKSWNPEVHEELIDTVMKLEAAKGDAQDVEFTVQDGTLYVLQTRNAKRSAKAAVRIAVEKVKAGSITLAEARKRVTYRDWLLAQAVMVDPKFKGAPLGTGIPACGGIVTGVVVHTSDAAVKRVKEGVILVTKETTPDDIDGMIAARGMLTLCGGATSHAAVVARSMNKPCVVGLSVPLDVFPEGSIVSIDGSTGRVWSTPVPTVDGAEDPYVKALTEMLVQESKVRLVDEVDGDMIDVSDLSETVAVKRIVKALKTRETVLVDVRRCGGVESEMYDKMFGLLRAEHGILLALSLGCPKDRIRVLTSDREYAESLGLKVVPSVFKPEDLVMAEGDFLLGVSGPWVDKLVKWKQALEGASPMKVGTVGPGNFVSKCQLACSTLG